MEMYYTNDTLYITLYDTLSFSLIHQLKKKLYAILDTYHISNVEISLFDDTVHESPLLEELIQDYNTRYSGRIIVK